MFYGDIVHNTHHTHIYNIMYIVTFYHFDAMEYTKVRSGVLECFQKLGSVYGGNF